MISQRLKQQAQGLNRSAPAPLSIYQSVQNFQYISTFTGLLNVWRMGLWSLCIPSGLFSIHWFAFSIFTVMAFILSYYIFLKKEQNYWDKRKLPNFTWLKFNILWKLLWPCLELWSTSCHSWVSSPIHNKTD